MDKILFTYIVPTQLKFGGLEKHLSNICDCQFIDRVIIVNSSGKNYYPTEFGKPLYQHRDKILVINSSNGTAFKNMAWNVGVCYIKKSSNYIILASDFLTFDSSVINLVVEQIDDLPKLGVIGMHDEVLGEYNDVNYIYTEEVNELNPKFGTLMFLERNKYVPIIGVKHLYGDKYIFNALKDKGFNNFTLRSDSFRIKNEAIEYSIEERLQIALDTDFWKTYHENKKGLLIK